MRWHRDVPTQMLDGGAGMSAHSSHRATRGLMVEWAERMQISGCGQGGSRPECRFAFPFFFFILFFFIFAFKFKFQIQTISNIYQQLQHVSNYITLFIIIISFEKFYRA